MQNVPFNQQLIQCKYYNNFLKKSKNFLRKRQELFEWLKTINSWEALSLRFKFHEEKEGSKLNDFLILNDITYERKAVRHSIFRKNANFHSKTKKKAWRNCSKRGSNTWCYNWLETLSSNSWKTTITWSIKFITKNREISKIFLLEIIYFKWEQSKKIIKTI